MKNIYQRITVKLNNICYIVVTVLLFFCVYLLYENNKIREDNEFKSKILTNLMSSSFILLKEIEYAENDDLKANVIVQKHRDRVKQDVIDFSKEIDDVNYHIYINYKSHGMLNLLRFDKRERTELFESVRSKYENLDMPESVYKDFIKNKMKDN